jgi:hypothetical protein
MKKVIGYIIVKGTIWEIYEDGSTWDTGVRSDE